MMLDGVTELERQNAARLEQVAGVRKCADFVRENLVALGECLQQLKNCKEVPRPLLIRVALLLKKCRVSFMIGKSSGIQVPTAPEDYEPPAEEPVKRLGTENLSDSCCREFSLTRRKSRESEDYGKTVLQGDKDLPSDSQGWLPDIVVHPATGPEMAHEKTPGKGGPTETTEHHTRFTQEQTLITVQAVDAQKQQDDPDKKERESLCMCGCS